MSSNEFVDYVGDYRVHDSRVIEVISNDNMLTVILQTEEKEVIKFEFINISSVKSHNPIGMILYSISEMKTEKPFRKLVFVNWDEEGESFLEVISENFRIIG